jgi:hypothetical protein
MAAGFFNIHFLLIRCEPDRRLGNKPFSEKNYVYCFAAITSI